MFCWKYGENIGKNISQNLISKYSQRFLDHAKQYDTDALKTSSKRAIQKTAEAVGDLIANKMLIKLLKSQKLHHRIIQLQIKKKCLEKYLSLRKKDRK